MFGRVARLAGLTSVVGLLAAPAAHASARISVQIGVPAPVVVPAPPPMYPAPPPMIYSAPPAPYGYVWEAGYYVPTRFGYQWVPGRWVRSSYDRRGFAHERWEHSRRSWDRDGGRRDWRR